MEQNIKGVPIHYVVEGSDRPIIVLHGTPLDHHSVKAALEPIFLPPRNRWSRIYIDLPGHGKTPGPEWIKNNDQMVDIVVDFIKATIPEHEHFAIIGESYGGYLAQGIVHQMRDSVAGLLLWTPAKYPRSERKPATFAVRVKNDNLASQLKTNLEKWIFKLLVVQSEEAMDFMRVNLLPGCEIADEKFGDRVLGTRFSFDLDSSFQFQKPTLIISGRQDSVVGYADAYDTLNKNYPCGTMVIIDGAGHATGFTEGLKLFRASVNEWLDCLEQS
jgi:pimeloyl-ACP methyl ester carboxylesterase